MNESPADRLVMLLALGALGVGGVLVYQLWRVAQHPQEAGAAAGRVAVELPKGVVLGAGDALGVPRVDAGRCEACIRAGDRAGAFTACDAATALTFYAQGRAAALDRIEKLKVKP